MNNYTYTGNIRQGRKEIKFTDCGHVHGASAKELHEGPICSKCQKSNVQKEAYRKTDFLKSGDKFESFVIRTVYKDIRGKSFDVTCVCGADKHYPASILSAIKTCGCTNTAAQTRKARNKVVRLPAKPKRLDAAYGTDMKYIVISKKTGEYTVVRTNNGSYRFQFTNLSGEKDKPVDFTGTLEDLLMKLVIN